MEKEGLIQQVKRAGQIVTLTAFLATAGAGCGNEKLPTYSAPEGNNGAQTSGTSSGENSGSQSPNTTGDTQLNAGQCTLANAGDVIEGDVNINGQWTTDHIATTGQITIMQESGTVCAPYGADVQRGVMNQSDGGTATLRRDAQQMQQSGCTNGCSVVLVNNWPSGQSIQIQ